MRNARRVSDQDNQRGSESASDQYAECEDDNGPDQEFHLALLHDASLRPVALRTPTSWRGLCKHSFSGDTQRHPIGQETAEGALRLQSRNTFTQWLDSRPLMATGFAEESLDMKDFGFQRLA
jgi:hypothetical protein